LLDTEFVHLRAELFERGGASSRDHRSSVPVMTYVSR
jgi:hypothetical protein